MKCDECQKDIGIGEWPWCPHGFPESRHKGFEPYEDIGLGQTVTGWGDINKACRPQWQDDHVVKIEPKDRSPQYFRELNERRRERAEQALKERRR